MHTVKDTKTGKFYAVKKIYNDKSHKNRELDIMEIVDSNFVIKKLKNFCTYAHDNEEE